jgi:hypothetical protein
MQLLVCFMDKGPSTDKDFMMTSFCLGMAGTLNFCEKSQLFYHRIIT